MDDNGYSEYCEKMAELELNKEVYWDCELDENIRNRILDIISWRESHLPEWYLVPGRTIVLRGISGARNIKIKGAGFYNPPNVSFSGLKRTTTSVPVSELPMQPLQKAFKRDLVHVDPSTNEPFEYIAVHSINAPVGGMTLATAKNDQRVFKTLQRVKLPSNEPVAVIEYASMELEGKRMGASVSILPNEFLTITPFDLYLNWHKPLPGDCIPFLMEYSGKDDFDIDNGRDVLRVLSKLSRVAGDLICRFTVEADMYRFSGSPDNWSMKKNAVEPLFFSDVDTCRFMADIAPAQRPWEMIRNLLTAMHQWFYFFLPTLTYKASPYGYRQFQEFDFLRGLIEGFFRDANNSLVDDICISIWSVLKPVSGIVDSANSVSLRGGEGILEQVYPRPAFYAIFLALLAPLIEESELPKKFPMVDLSIAGIMSYIENSLNHESHTRLFPSLDKKRVLQIISEHMK